jgi:hypothetical protein
MPEYSGEVTLRFWTEADNEKQVNQKLNKMLDEWNLATNTTIAWDDVDWTIKEDKSETLPCQTCGVAVDKDTYEEELGFCVPCQHDYFDEEKENA